MVAPLSRKYLLAAVAMAVILAGFLWWLPLHSPPVIDRSIAKTEILKIVGDPMQLRSQAQFRPVFLPGSKTLQGFQFMQVQASSIYEKMGLQKGDAILAVNNTSISDADSLKQIGDLLKSLSVDRQDFQIKVERRGEIFIFKYKIQ